MSTKVEHQPKGDPCTTCGLPAAKHRIRTRPEHEAVGYPYCGKCGELSEKHRGYRYRMETRNEWNRAHYIGIDGEGQGKAEHKYVLLAASDEAGERTWIAKPEAGRDRLTTQQCLELIIQLPQQHTKVFSYSFNYDLTKLLTDVDDSTLYYLFRPELRQRAHDAFKGPWPVKWNEWKLNLQGTKFTVYLAEDEKKEGEEPAHRVTVWDLFRFYQSKFVNALKDWKVGNKELWDRMALMKDKRAEFDKESPDAVLAYCLSECRSMAELGRRLVEAHNDAELKLKAYYGAGSSGAAMLDKMGIKAKIAKNAPDEMKEPVATAFFGGRFENSVVGNIEGTVYGYDISSAYPYQLYMLPCLEHARWRHTTKRADIDNCKQALVSYVLHSSNHVITNWAPFPFRESSGTISYPRRSGGGWVWHNEYLAGERMAPECVEFIEAWVYESDCVCRPFHQLPQFYLDRLRIGKEGPGIVLKLAMNSCYGKLAQSVGNALYNSWIWAGMITSGCRAQILDLIGLHKDRSNVLMIATDGVYTRERIECPEPMFTGTNVLIDGKRKPLGGWEEKIHNRGVFVARPGIYFPLSPTLEEIKDVRGRGVGKGVVLENWELIVKHWEQWGITKPCRVANVSRFCGGKTSISRRKKQDTEGYEYKRACGEGSMPGHDMPSYGQWVQRPIDMSFNPRPKREGINPDGFTLALREFPIHMSSYPYRKALIDRDELKGLLLNKQQMKEQPDGDLTIYE
jgi:DNA polymerase type B, organellar and viral